MSESRKYPVTVQPSRMPERYCRFGIRRAKHGDSVGQLSSVRSPVGKVRRGPRACQCFCQVGA